MDQALNRAVALTRLRKVPRQWLERPVISSAMSLA